MVARLLWLFWASLKRLTLPIHAHSAPLCCYGIRHTTRREVGFLTHSLSHFLPWLHLITHFIWCTTKKLAVALFKLKSVQSMYLYISSVRVNGLHARTFLRCFSPLLSWFVEEFLGGVGLRNPDSVSITSQPPWLRKLGCFGLNLPISVTQSSKSAKGHTGHTLIYALLLSDYP